MAVPATEWTLAMKDAARVATAMMELSGSTLKEGTDIDALARHLGENLGFSFRLLTAGADADAAKEVEQFLEWSKNDPAITREQAFREAADAMARFMDMHGYYIKDDFDDFNRYVRRELESVFAEPSLAPAP